MLLLLDLIFPRAMVCKLHLWSVNASAADLNVPGSDIILIWKPYRGLFATIWPHSELRIVLKTAQEAPVHVRTNFTFCYARNSGSVAGETINYLWQMGSWCVSTANIYDVVSLIRQQPPEYKRVQTMCKYICTQYWRKFPNANREIELLML